MSDELVNVSGVDTTGGTVPNDGSGFKIGDGYILTAAHIVYEFNEKDDVTQRIINPRSGTTIFELRNYAYKYLTAAMALSDPLPPPRTDSTVAADVESGLTSSDIVVINGGGNVDKADLLPIFRPLIT